MVNIEIITPQLITLKYVNYITSRDIIFFNGLTEYIVNPISLAIQAYLLVEFKKTLKSSLNMLDIIIIIISRKIKL